MDYINFCQRLQQEIKTENLVSTALEMGLNLSREYEAKDVLLPQDTEQLMIIVKTANQYRVPLYPIGNGTRFAQGVKPFPEGIFVSLKKMNNCIEYRPNNMNIEVEAGITVSQIQKILAKDNIYFPIDSNDRSTIGGLIAANGYGRKKFLHKTTRFYVMGMEFVSPRGELIKVGGRTIKNVSSYDLHQLLAGSWGVFGIITKAILKVKPKPEKELVLETTAKDGTELLKVLEKVLFSEKINLASLTFEQSHWGFPVRAELEGFAQTLQEQQEMLENEYGFRVPEGFFTTQSKENITIALPLKNYIKGLEKILELKQKKPQLNIRGNAGSGLIYLNFSGIESIIEKIKDIANTLEGDLVFENSRLTDKERGAGFNGLLREIKKTVDPNNILVPASRVIKE